MKSQETEIDLIEALKKLNITRDYYYKNLRVNTKEIPSVGRRVVIDLNSLNNALDIYKSKISKRGRKKNLLDKSKI